MITMMKKYGFIFLTIMMVSCKQQDVKSYVIPPKGSIDIVGYSALPEKNTFDVDMRYKIDNYDPEASVYICGYHQHIGGKPKGLGRFLDCKIDSHEGIVSFTWKPIVVYEKYPIIHIYTKENPTPTPEIIEVKPPYELVVFLYQSRNTGICKSDKILGRKCGYLPIAKSAINIIDVFADL